MRHVCNDRAWMELDRDNDLWEIWRSPKQGWVVDNNTSEFYHLPKNWFIQTRTAEHIGR